MDLDDFEFLVAFFGVVLFLSSSGAISFVVLPLVSALPHGTSFIRALLGRHLGVHRILPERGYTAVWGYLAFPLT